MKKVITLLSAVLFTSMTFAQVYNAPESVEFDYANNRWFIGNHTGHTILIKNCTACALQPFASGLTSGPHGLEIVNDTLYACDGGSLRTYNINTGASVFNISLGATFLNGITHDNNGNLYITDYSGNKIYRFNVNTRQYNIFVASPGTNPNGIIFDQPNNRCVYVLWGGALKSVLLSDSTVSVALASSGLSSLDGIAKDGSGNYYVSAWGTNTVTRFTNTFTSPTTVVTSLNQPADIFYNTLTDTLAVPNSGSTLNNVQFYYFGSASGILESTESNFNLTVSPNPISERTEINYESNNDGKVSVRLFDIKGRLVKIISEENESKGKHVILLDKTGIASGTYFLNLNNNNLVETKRIVIK